MNWFHVREPVSAWTHFVPMALALPGTCLLLSRCRSDPLKRAGMWIFGLTMMFCYAGSWLFHSVPESLADTFVLIDHIGIFLLIAGTVTPIGLVILRGRWRIGLVGGIWLLALVGIGLRVSAEMPIRAMTASYLVMGWIGCTTYFELVRALGPARVRLLWMGGVIYSTGAVINGLGWPVLVPGVFEAHELFHLFVMAGTVCHFWFIYTVIAPYPRLAVLPAPLAIPAVAARRPAMSLDRTA
jgi:hemolysin III